MSLEKGKRLLAVARSTHSQNEARNAADLGVGLILKSEHRWWPEPGVLREMITAFQRPGLDPGKRRLAALHIAKLSSNSGLVPLCVYTAETKAAAEAHLREGGLFTKKQAIAAAHASWDFLRVMLRGSETHDGESLARRAGEIHQRSKEFERAVSEFNQQLFASSPRPTRKRKASKAAKKPRSHSPSV